MSATGLLALLKSSTLQVQSFAINQLLVSIDYCWPEVSEHLSTIEELFENFDADNKTTAALLISKIYYHLTEYKEALEFGLEAQHLLFQCNDDQYRELIASKCIQEYLSMNKLKKYQSTESFDGQYFRKLEKTVNEMFEHSLANDGANTHLIGIGLEAERLDIIERVLSISNDKRQLLQYVFKLASQCVKDETFRNKVFGMIIDNSTNLENTDYFIIAKCLMLTGDAKTIAELLTNLSVGSHDSSLVAYQLAFDVCENCSPDFRHQINYHFLETETYLTIFIKSELKIENTETTDPTEAIHTAETVEIRPDEIVEQRLLKLDSILSKEKERDIHSQFLSKNNHADLSILKKLKEHSKNDKLKNATILANGFMNCGTTCDQFLNDEKEWVKGFVNWAKFNAISSIGGIYRGNFNKAMEVLNPYLPSECMAGKSFYAAGGSLFSLGLASANYGDYKTINYILEHSRSATNETLRHGACLGLGLASMGSINNECYEQLKLNLHTDDAIVGEAASIGMGLVQLGSGDNDAFEEMLFYLTETTHEKISRGLVLSMAMTMLNKQSKANCHIERLLKDSNHMVRWAGAATIALAYCGTSNDAMIDKLMKLAVTDTNDDVRQCATSGIGYLLCRNKEFIPNLMRCLSDSYNARVRFGCAIAIGIGCAGTALREAIEIVERLLDDKVDFVRQGAYISMAMILMQQNESSCKVLKDFRQRLLKTLDDKYKDSMTKFGVILAIGILNAGGQNMEISFINRNGNLNGSTVVGLFVFQNYWYWYPLGNFLNLAFTPTFVALLDEDLGLSDESVSCNDKQSKFSLLEPFREEKVETKKDFKPVVLSTVRREKGKNTESVETKEIVNEPMETKEMKDDSIGFVVENLSRIIRNQLSCLKLEPEQESRLIKPINEGGIILLKNKHIKESLNLEDSNAMEY